MRAAVIHGARDLRNVSLPERDPGPGEILIRTLKASICNATDIHIWEGELGEELRPPFPHVLGHERSGEVVAIGDEVEGFAPGDRLGLWAKMDGAFAEYDVLRPWEYPLVKLSEGVSDDAGSLLEFVGATLRALHSARLRPADRVLILGQGVQGIMLAQEARLMGASRVVGVDLLPFRLRTSEAMGLDVGYELSGKSYAQAKDGCHTAPVPDDRAGGGAQVEEQVDRYQRSSRSSSAIHSPLGSPMPVFRAAESPRLCSCEITRSSALRSARSRCAAASYAGMTAVTVGSNGPPGVRSGDAPGASSCCNGRSATESPERVTRRRTSP
jgi:hypothetical protein